LSSAELFGVDTGVTDLSDFDSRRSSLTLDGYKRTAELVIGERRLRKFQPAIRELRLRCGQQDDFTTDLQYFIAANAQKKRRVAAVLFRQDLEIEACVLFFEYCKFGIGHGILNGGDAVGGGLVAGPEGFRVEYVHLAAQFLLQHWRIHGVCLTVRASLDHCIKTIEPENKYRLLAEKNVQHRLRLESTYRAMLGAMGPRTRRSLATKRQQLEARAQVAFLPSLEPAQALHAMLELQPRCSPHRITRFYHARYDLLRENPEFFSMGLRLPDGTWLSVLSGWRKKRITYIDLQMNDMHFKKESLSAVMRAFMLEHEIRREQESINFVGGTSLLLRRYCQPIEPCTDIFLWRPCLRATICRRVIPPTRPARAPQPEQVKIISLPVKH
jgi:hypothetical protein